MKYEDFIENIGRSQIEVESEGYVRGLGLEMGREFMILKENNGGKVKENDCAEDFPENIPESRTKEELKEELKRYFYEKDAFDDHLPDKDFIKDEMGYEGIKEDLDKVCMAVERWVLDNYEIEIENLIKSW